MPESEPQLSVDYFRQVLEREAAQLNQLCDRWAAVLDQQPPEPELEDFLGAIRTTIGQAKLLMSQRFKQFSTLIDHCEFNTGQLPTRLNDLSGFWEMISFQVEDVRQKFSSLELDAQSPTK